MGPIVRNFNLPHFTRLTRLPVPPSKTKSPSICTILARADATEQQQISRGLSCPAVPEFIYLEANMPCRRMLRSQTWTCAIHSWEHFHLEKYNKYRVSHLLVEIGSGCTTILLSCSADSTKFPLALAELGKQWNTQNQSQPEPSPRADGTPCTAFTQAALIKKEMTAERN